MWFWLFIAAASVLMLAGAVFSDFFWWSMVGFGILWAVAIVIEVIWTWKQEDKVVQSPVKDGAPAEVPVMAAATAGTVTTVAASGQHQMCHDG
jgi:hypothetical protein